MYKIACLLGCLTMAAIASLAAPSADRNTVAARPHIAGIVQSVASEGGVARSLILRTEGARARLVTVGVTADTLYRVGTGNRPACAADIRPGMRVSVLLSDPGTAVVARAVRITSPNAGHDAITAVRRKVLFICTGNSCRSQMAEGLLRQMAGDRNEVFSAGTKPAAAVYPLAVKAMTEIGVDMSAARPKSVAELPTKDFDVVITVCDEANKNCPYLPGKFRRFAWFFDDPPKAQGTDEQKMQVCRRVRDEIRVRIAAWLDGSTFGAVAR